MTRVMDTPSKMNYNMGRICTMKYSQIRISALHVEILFITFTRIGGDAVAEHASSLTKDLICEHVDLIGSNRIWVKYHRHVPNHADRNAIKVLTTES